MENAVRHKAVRRRRPNDRYCRRLRSRFLVLTEQAQSATLRRGTVQGRRFVRPVVCFVESPIQLIGEVRAPIPPRPGQLERYDCEYKRYGTANLFVFLDVHRPWRKVKVTASRTALDFAACMRDLADVQFPKAARIRVVLD